MAVYVNLCPSELPQVVNTALTLSPCTEGSISRMSQLMTEVSVDLALTDLCKCPTQLFHRCQRPVCVRPQVAVYKTLSSLEMIF